jgi:ADP-heptose:LPS heptosyltransferase
MILGNPYVDEVLEFDRNLMSGLDLIRTVRNKKYEMVIDLFGNPRTALLTRLSGARHRVGFRFRGRTYAYTSIVDPRGDRVHNTQFNLDALEAIGIRPDRSAPYVPVRPEDDAVIDGYLSAAGLSGMRLVAFFAGGGWYTKRWGIGRFAAVADALVERFGITPVLLWGPGEQADAVALSGHMLHPAYIPPATSLRELAALVKRCILIVTNDSGPMHIAAAVGTRVVAVFGPTDPNLQGPVGDGHVVIRNEALACLGCNLTRCPIGHPCMEHLAPESVLREAGRLLDVAERTRQ